MVPVDNLVTENEFFSTQYEDNVLVVRTKKHLTHLCEDIHKIDIFYSFHDELINSKNIKAVVSIGAKAQTGSAPSLAFLCNVLRSDNRKHLLERYFNLTNHYVLTMANLDKITVHADHGLVSLYHFGMSLAFDYRIVAEGTVFENLGTEIGMVPKGGAAYFLSRMLGMKRAVEVLQWTRFSAEEALQLGLVDRIVPLEDLEKEAMHIARRHLQRPISTLLNIRKLLKSDINELSRSLDMEDQIILKRITDPDFKSLLEVHCPSA
jgi:2-(1,2-epoxy-1,2-dihydrophenyl)acetyl-CoA isomerase